MKDIKKYLSPKAKEMIQHDKPQKDLFRKIDKMVELEWSLPDDIAKLKWMRKMVSTDPLAAITTGRRTLSTVRPQVFIQPLNNHAVTKEMANKNEQNLLLQLKNAERRAEFDIVGDIVESALRYDMVCAFTVPVTWQLKGTGIKRAIKNANGFMVMVESPLDIYPRFSPLGLESVLQVKVLPAREVIAFYGDKAQDLRKKIEKEDKELYITLYNYWDYDQRATWCSGLGEELSLTDGVDYIIDDEKMELPFLPWSIEKGGTSLSGRMDHQVRPMLGPIAHARMWDDQNIAKSIAFAEGLGYAAAPRYKTTTFADDGILVEYGDINKPVNLKPGEDIEALQVPAIDQNLLHILDRTKAEMDQLTGIKNLANLDPPSGTAFATVNAVIKAATSSLDPAKKLAEAGLAGIFEDMLQWAAHTKEDITALGDGSNLAGDDSGEEYRLKWSHIQPDMIDVEVKLSAHVPTDRLQKINAATLLMKELDYSKEDAYKELDIANPEEIREKWEQEQFDSVMVANELKKMAASADLEIQKQQMQMQMQAQSAMQAKQMQMQKAAQQGGGANQQSASNARMAGEGRPPTRTGNPRRDAQSQAAQGRSGFDTSRGGQSPNETNPEGFTREGATGVDKQGGTI